MATHVQPGHFVRVAGCAALAAASAALALGIAVGTAPNGYADDGGGGLVATPTHHEAFPGQNPQTDRPWYQTPSHDSKPASTNPFDTPLGQLFLGDLGPLGKLAKLGGLGGLF